MKPHMCGVRKEIGGPNRPMMLMMLALGGLQGAVFVAVGTSVGRTALYDKHETVLACIAQAKPRKNMHVASALLWLLSLSNA